MRNVCVFYIPPPREQRLPVFWSGMGEETRRLASYRWDGLHRGLEDHLTWQLTLSGRGRIRIGANAPVVLEAGMGFMARFPSDYCYYYQPGDPAWHFIWVSWTGPALRAIWESLSATPVRLTALSTTGPMIGLIRSLIRSRRVETSISRGNAADSFRMLLELAQAKPELDSLPRSRQADPILPRLGRAFQRRPDAPVGKDGLANQLELSRFQLYRRTKREAGMSPKEWAMRQRLDQAFQLLRGTRLPVAAVARKVGMPDANYFSRFFRRQTGFAPHTWRKLFASADT